MEIGFAVSVRFKVSATFEVHHRDGSAKTIFHAEIIE